jgi:hypothetical protein
MRRPAVPGTYSLGARLRDGCGLPLAEWFQGLDTKGPLDVRALHLGTVAPEGSPIMPPPRNMRSLALAIRERGVGMIQSRVRALRDEREAGLSRHMPFLTAPTGCASL